jgi:hypothetical protein
VKSKLAGATAENDNSGLGGKKRKYKEEGDCHHPSCSFGEYDSSSYSNSTTPFLFVKVHHVNLIYAAPEGSTTGPICLRNFETILAPKSTTKLSHNFSKKRKTPD